MSGFLNSLADKVGDTLGIDLHAALEQKLQSLLSPDTIQAIADRADSSGLGDHVRSWIGNGDNLPVSPEQIKDLLNNDEVQAMVAKTGLPADTLLPALARFLPDAIDKKTPAGEVPGPGQN
ncbi:YidB family protein [Acetobacter sp. AN02]|uniref:YidB family protein n=1 Tax=Acetobacter sp. AN02 TaxID=2894186 RepID=UPI00243442C7|nr:YidB family protein [Acetobacter sp. AN02]MDG6094481.1 YidB family protein [Acetobacter sp. AN02]